MPRSDRPRDAISRRASSEVLPPLAAQIVRVNAEALKPLQAVSKRETATETEAAAALRALIDAQAQINAAVHEYAGALILGGMARDTVAALLHTHRATLAKNLATVPWAHARGADLTPADTPTGWAVVRDSG